MEKRGYRGIGVTEYRCDGDAGWLDGGLLLIAILIVY